MYIAAGHSDVDPGACANGRREADIAVDFRTIVGVCLKDLGVAYDTDGDGKKNLPLRDAVAEARHHRTAVEFHCNASSKASATGVEILCAPKHNTIAAKLCKAIATSLGIRNRGVKPENAGQHHRLAFVQAGGMVVELFFITNPSDLRAYDENKWLAARQVASILAAH